jgi:leucyl-tRNA synthetase
MECLNEFRGVEQINEGQYKTFLRLLAPFAPHVSEEIWHRLGAEYSIHRTDWPAFDPDLAESDTVTLAIQIDGTVRGEITVDKNVEEPEIIEKAQQQEGVQSRLENTTITRRIYVPGELVNFVTS